MANTRGRLNAFSELVKKAAVTVNRAELLYVAEGPTGYWLLCGPEDKYGGACLELFEIDRPMRTIMLQRGLICRGIDHGPDGHVHIHLITRDYVTDAYNLSAKISYSTITGAIHKYGPHAVRYMPIERICRARLMGPSAVTFCGVTLTAGRPSELRVVDYNPAALVCLLFAGAISSDRTAMVMAGLRRVGLCDDVVCVIMAAYVYKNERHFAWNL